MGPHPAVAAIRLAVRRVLRDVLEEAAASPDRLHRPQGVGDTPAAAPVPRAGTAAPPAVELSHCPRPVGSAAAVPPPAPLPEAPAASPAPATTAVPDSSGGTVPSAAPAPAARPDAEQHFQDRADRADQAVHAPGASAPLVLVACSGGADSMALASALAFEAPRLGVRAGGITVDHGLQDGSDIRATEVADRLRALGLDPVEAVAVAVGRESAQAAHGASYTGGGGRRVGPEAAARDARYAALDAAAERHGAAAVLLGHTRDDQAETVLLGLARGSGTRSLSGMAAVSGGPGAEGRYRRPFLQLDRQTARRACLAQSLPVWDDPHNTDPGFTRSRLRHEGLPALEKALGKGVVEALARTAQLSRDDADALDAWATQAEAGVRDSAGRLECTKLHALPPAVRRRILRRAAIGAGAPAGSLFARHIEEIDRLITGWHGQGAINLPGRVVARRQDGRLVLRQG